MKIKRQNKLFFALLTISLTLLSGCSSTNPYTGETQTSDATKGTAIGAIGGAAIGMLAGGGRGALIGGAIGGLGGGLIGNSMDKENAELRSALEGTGVQVHRQGNSIQLIMASDVTFDTGQASVRSNFYPILNSVASVVKKYEKTNIVITGYTDNVGGDAYNQILSENRAKSVGDYLVFQGVSVNRIVTEGRGKRDPVASNKTAGGRAINRRVVITLRPMS